jgi:hypothetical protein
VERDTSCIFSDVACIFIQSYTCINNRYTSDARFRNLYRSVIITAVVARRVRWAGRLERMGSYENVNSLLVP